MLEVSQRVCYIAIAKDDCISVVIPMYVRASLLISWIVRWISCYRFVRVGSITFGLEGSYKNDYGGLFVGFVNKCGLDVATCHQN